MQMKETLLSNVMVVTKVSVSELSATILQDGDIISIGKLAELGTFFQFPGEVVKAGTYVILERRRVNSPFLQPLVLLVVIESRQTFQKLSQQQCQRKDEFYYRLMLLIDQKFFMFVLVMK